MQPLKYLFLVVMLAWVVIIIQRDKLFESNDQRQVIEAEVSPQLNQDNAANKTQRGVNLAAEENTEFNTLDIIAPDIQQPKSQQPESERDAVMLEISERQYSDDAYVELYALRGISKLCSETDAIEEWMDSSLGYMTPEQKNIMGGVKVKCKSHNAQYPTVSSLSSDDLMNQISPNSQLGQLLKQRKNDQELSRAEKGELAERILLAAIESKNSFIAIESSFNYSFGYQAYNNSAQALKSNDQLYLSQIKQLAVTHMACGFTPAEACQPDGYLMVIMCAQQPDSCGMDYYTWFQNNTLPGMRQDVNIMIDFLQSQSQVR
ncbi:hypothetical protein OS175_00440 [Marinicella sp. S1101]|uniref:hypothetical protein n=1 Tax=Marinicella marina TaxID=2996016 RepID=UPI002260CAEF|nr:hypothetical protein [Marinicella marina]MCX7552330.1 hypothetical protein [Marinicella marina]MDJ1139205.1 hypothetical protein [Marinicella marina]